MEAEFGAMQPQAKLLGPQGAGAGEEGVSLEPPDGAWPWGCPVSDSRLRYISILYAITVPGPVPAAMGAQKWVLSDFLDFQQRLRAPGPDSWAAPIGEARGPRALTPHEGCVQGPHLHGDQAHSLQQAANCPWSEIWFSNVGGVQLERSWHQRGRKDPSPSRLHSGGWCRRHTPTPCLLPTQTRTVSCGLSVSSLLRGDGTMPGLGEGRWCTWSPRLPPFVSHAPAALGWPSLPPKHLASASWLASRSPSLSLLPVRTCVGTESLQGWPPSWVLMPLPGEPAVTPVCEPWWRRLSQAWW